MSLAADSGTGVEDRERRFSVCASFLWGGSSSDEDEDEDEDEGEEGDEGKEECGVDERVEKGLLTRRGVGLGEVASNIVLASLCEDSGRDGTIGCGNFYAASRKFS